MQVSIGKYDKNVTAPNVVHICGFLLVKYVGLYLVKYVGLYLVKYAGLYW